MSPLPPPGPPLAFRTPVLALPSAVVFPGSVVTAEVTRRENLRALARGEDPGLGPDERFVAISLDDPEGPLEPDLLGGVGTLVRLVGRLQLPGGGIRLVLHGLRRVRIEGVVREDGTLLASIAEYERGRSSEELEPEALARTVSLLRALARVDPRFSEDLAGMVELNGADPARLSDLAAANLPLEHIDRARLLAEPDPVARIRLLNRSLAAALERARVGHSVEDKVRERIRRSFLREQLAVIRDELDEPDPHALEADRIAERILSTPLPEGARRSALHEVESLRRSSPSSPEAVRIKDHLEWMLELDWSTGENGEAFEREDRFQKVVAALGASHEGLQDVKERVKEFLAVHQLGGEARGTVLCFIGPPGTGKSSMGRALARALARRFVNIPVGGITDEGELSGLPHKLEGALPGAILQGIHDSGTNDPVVLLDEIDKLSLGGEGNAGGVLLQLLDPEQNSEFLDHYLGVPFDLSRCLFLATANDPEGIPCTLLDRMEAIEFAGYTDSQKLRIARKHLIPRAVALAGLEAWQFKLSPAALRTVIRGYTEEAGVRQLQRTLNSLARKAAIEVLRGGKGSWLRKADLVRLLGPRTVDEDLRLLRPAVGVATGLAWTSAGGALLPIEALAMPGSGNTTLTGHIGEIMRESVQAALSYVRSRFDSLGVAQNFLDGIDIHVHFPSGGTPKDGPSAGIAIATALVSLVTRVQARHDVAMTGEMSLLGNVLPVGGVREKLLAAIRAGIPEAIVPARNAEEVLRLPPEVRAHLTIHLVEHVLEVFELALVPRVTAREEASTPSTPRKKRASGRPRQRRRPTG